MNDTVNYLRMERGSTGSFITYVLPEPMHFNLACNYAENQMPGWEVIMGCRQYPDNEGEVIIEAVNAIRNRNVLLHSFTECVHVLRSVVSEQPVRGLLRQCGCLIDFQQFAAAVWAHYCNVVSADG